MFKPIAIAVALTLVGGGTALAQNQTGRALVDALFGALEAEATAGLPQTAFVRGVLPKETTADHSFNAQAGRTYAVVGVCDENCTDIDLAVFGPDGTNLGSDVEEDDTPVAIFEAPSTGAYKITVLMATCASNCNYGVKVYQAE